YTGHDAPDYTLCWVNYGGGYGNGYWGPLCLGLGPGGYPWGNEQNVFYSGIFSVHPTGVLSGTSVYTTSTYDDGKQRRGVITPARLDSTVSSTGSPVSVAPGGQLALEWSCLPSRQLNGQDKTGQGIFSEGSWSSWTIYTVSLATGSLGTGPSFNSQNYFSHASTITAPSTPGVYTYSLTCSGPWNQPTMSIPVTVTTPPPTIPTCTINASSPVGDGGSSTLTYTVAGTPTSVTIDDSQGDASIHAPVTPAPQQSAALQADNSPVTFTMTVENAEGSSQCLATAVVTAAPIVCPEHTHDVDGFCVPYYGFVDGGGGVYVPDVGFTCVDDTCTPTVPTCPGAHEVNPPTCTCELGYVVGVGGACVPNPDVCNNIPGVQGTPPAHGVQNIGGSCSCSSGYELQGNVCLAVGAVTGGLTATPALVHSGARTTLSWGTANMAECAVTSSDGGTPLSTALTSTGIQSPPITHRSIFTLSCIDNLDTPFTSSVGVNLIPSVIEL
ncbi:MAG: hypothetical protein Q7R71_00755, partial [bacterium]|nr:hypothetical protein [bacterium]